MTGWIKRGPVGLIGHTKGDADETVACLLEDYRNGLLDAPEDVRPEAMCEFLESRGHPYTTWEGWLRLDAHERALGQREDRERVKVVERDDMIQASRDHGGHHGGLHP